MPQAHYICQVEERHNGSYVHCTSFNKEGKRKQVGEFQESKDQILRNHQKLTNFEKNSEPKIVEMKQKQAF